MLKKIIWLTLILAISLTATWFFVSREKNNNSAQLYPVWINHAEIKVELAESQGARGQGLGDRKSLPKDQGMLFVFDKPDRYPFWMRAMNFPLDIIWLDSDFRVVDMTENVKPETYPHAFAPAQEALYVLETNAGWAHAHGVKIDSTAVFPENMVK